MTDRDPGKDIYPQKDEEPRSNNPVFVYQDEINRNDRMRLFISPLKTFEYDLATYNPAVMAKTLRELWPIKRGEVYGILTTIIGKENKYDDLSELSNDVQFIYNHIESPEIGKGIFAYELSGNIDNSFVVPSYISEAVLWVCGGRS